MSNDAPPNKRRRGDDSFTQVSRCDNLWFDDGNVVLQAEHVQFRVHRSLLARHSSVFRDMFSFPQPQVESGDAVMVDRCPLVHLLDSSSEVEEVLKILYDGAIKVFPENNRTLTFSQVAAMARLGRKYDISFLYKAATAYMEENYPSTAEYWTLGQMNAFDLEITTQFSGAETAARAINLIVDLSLERYLPAACLYYIRDVISHSDMETFFSNKTNPPLHPEMHVKVLVGREKLIFWLNTRKIVEAKTVRIHDSCRSKDDCSEVILESFNDATIWPRDQGDPVQLRSYRDFDSDDTLNLCHLCHSQLQRVYHRVRNEAWSLLPSFFGMSHKNWDQLRNEVD